MTDNIHWRFSLSHHHQFSASPRIDSDTVTPLYTTPCLSVYNYYLLPTTKLTIVFQSWSIYVAVMAEYRWQEVDVHDVLVLLVARMYSWSHDPAPDHETIHVVLFPNIHMSATCLVIIRPYKQKLFLCNICIHNNTGTVKRNVVKRQNTQ